jgi:hypothetical protein
VEREVSVKTILATIYHGVPLKLLAVYGRKAGGSRPNIHKKSNRISDRTAEKIKKGQKKSIFCG